MRRAWKRTLGSCVWVVVLVGALSSTEAVVIDDFNQGALLLEPTNYSPGLIELQTALPTDSTVGGTRRVTAQTLGQAKLEINPGSGELAFEAINNYGYFTVEYGSLTPLAIDLRADGSDAFLLSFSNVSIADILGGCSLRVNGVGYEFATELAALDGSGTIRIPFSKYSIAPTFVVNNVVLRAIRVPSTSRLALDSFMTIPEPTTEALLLCGALIMWLFRKPDYQIGCTRRP